MEFGDASDEEAPPAPPRNKELLRNLRMQIVAMLQGMENDGSLRKSLDELFLLLGNSKQLSVNTSVSRDIRTRGMLEDVVAT